MGSKTSNAARLVWWWSAARWLGETAARQPRLRRPESAPGSGGDDLQLIEQDQDERLLHKVFDNVAKLRGLLDREADAPVGGKRPLGVGAKQFID